MPLVRPGFTFSIVTVYELLPLRDRRRQSLPFVLATSPNARRHSAYEVFAPFATRLLVLDRGRDRLRPTSYGRARRRRSIRQRRRAAQQRRWHARRRQRRRRRRRRRRASP